MLLQRYLGTAREEDSLNILLEFVPGGSIASLLGKFGSFPESVSDYIILIRGCQKIESCQRNNFDYMHDTSKNHC